MPEILYLQFTNPTAYPPLQHGALILKDRGWSIRFLGVSWPGSYNLRFPPALASCLQLLKAPAPGWRQKLFYFRFQFWAVLQAILCQPHWIYVSDPMATPAGLFLCLLGFRVVYHEHDCPATRPRSVSESFVFWCRLQLARRVRFNVLPQKSRCQWFQFFTGTSKPILKVWNCPRLNEISPVPRPARHPDQPLGIYYHGSINLTLLPLVLIEAAGATGLPIRIRVVGYETIGSIGAGNILRSAAQDYSPRLQLELKGMSDREVLFSHMDQMHLGWIAYNEEGVDRNLMHLAGASNKAFDYLSAGLPMLCNETAEWYSLFASNGVALTCDASLVSSIKKQLRWAYDNPHALADMGEAGRLITRVSWNYEAEFQKVSDRISF